MRIISYAIGGRPSFGLHPWYVKERTPAWLDTLRTYLTTHPQAPVGEIGLDRWIENPDLDAQVTCFRAQMQLATELDRALGYGLTLGVQTRIDTRAEHIAAVARIGNVYVNRNMIGAVVGVQPFGGEGLSGTGPKAGGPLYLLRFVAEQTVTVNTAAAGGNAALLAGGP